MNNHETITTKSQNTETKKIISNETQNSINQKKFYKAQNSDSYQSFEKESYQEMFSRAKKMGEGAFIPFVVAGDPDFETALDIVRTYVDNGADALEIGFPFSDPVADGPTVQAADLRSLKSGMTTKRGFEFIRRIREFTSIPIGILAYYNLIYKMGVDSFYKNASKSGVNGVLAADLPPEEAETAIAASQEYGIDQIFMVAQTTSRERLEKITEICRGFLYVVAVMGVTGARSRLESDTVELVRRVKEHTSIPIAVGFGISRPEHVKDVVNARSDGAIVASALLNIVAENLDDKDVMLEKIGDLARKLKEATRKDLD
jgi:tryptophan synthase alpha chain